MAQIERHELQTGELAIISRHGNRYNLYVVSTILGVAPEYLVEDGSLAECREELAETLESDICDAFCG